MEDTIHIQSEEAREKITAIFCKSIAFSALASTCIYVYLKIYELAFTTSIIAGLFIFFIYLNKKKFHNISRTAIITTTNLGTLFFSLYLGFDSGIYLYLFVAPLLIYLLFDFNETRKIFGFLLMYLVTFLIIFNCQNTTFCIANQLDEGIVKMIYSFNFCSAFVLCFGLVFYFANNNDKYILNLIKHKKLLTHEVELRTESEELVRKNLKEREILLSEVHHRVKNNLSIISALINMQIGNLKEESSKQVFEETKNRIYTMALIHNLLYQNNSFEKIDLTEYVNKFCQNITSSYRNKSDIKIEQQIEDIDIDLKTAVPLALIMNELVTNSYKHAFNNQNSGKIEIGIQKTADNHLLFWVKDNGVGMNEKVLESNGMGITIIKSLVEQMDGKITYERNNGNNFTIYFPIY